MSTLTLQLPGSQPVTHVLQEETITLGRMEGNTIVVDDASVSMFHARITKKDGAFFLKDLNSTNGTFVNGQQIREARLKDLDKVRIADVLAQFQADASAAVINLTPAAQSAPTIAKSAPMTALTPIPAPARPPQRPFNAGRFFASLVPYMGGIAALCVVSVLVWKLVHADRDGTAKPIQPVSSIKSIPPAATPAPLEKQRVATVKTNLPFASAADSASIVVNTNASVADLVKELNSPEVAERRRVVTALHSMGGAAKSATPALRAALKDPDAEVRMWAALTLINNECYDKAAVPILVGALRHDNPVIRQVACLSLGLIPYEQSERDSVVPALAQAAGKDTDEEVRRAALSALNVIDPDAGARVEGK
jgi:predicted component of type VI protein secretion system